MGTYKLLVEASNLMIALLLPPHSPPRMAKRLPPWAGAAGAPHADINDKRFAQVDALVKERVAPRAPLGYASIGIDEGWEGCKLGVNGTVHS